MYELREYQKDFIERTVEQYASNYRGIYLQDAPGLGKTIQAAFAAKTLQDVFNITLPVLVVCPKSLKYQWLDTVKDLVPATLVFSTDLFDTTNWYITHYEDFRKNFFEYALLNWAVCIFDEAHRFRNMRTQTYKSLQNFASKKASKFYIFLSATPFHKNPGELWPILKIINPQIISYWNFQEHFTKYVFNGFGNVPVGVKNPQALAQFLKPYVVKREYKDVASQIPDLISVPVHLEMSLEQSKLYQKIRVGTLLDELFISNVLSAITQRKKVTSNPKILGYGIDSVKLEWLKDFIEDTLLDSDDQLIVFCSFVETIKTLYMMFEKIVPCDYIAGQLSETQIQDSIKNFKDKKTKVLFCTYESGSTGLDFPQCKYAVMYDLNWSYIQTYQAIHRIYRISSTDHKIVYYLICKNTVDELVYISIQKKFDEKELVNEFMRCKDVY